MSTMKFKLKGFHYQTLYFITHKVLILLMTFCSPYFLEYNNFSTRCDVNITIGTQ